MKIAKHYPNHHCRMPLVLLAAVVLALGVSAASASTYSIPSNNVETQKIYWGTASGFDKPAEIDFEKVVKATPEYQEIKKKKVEQGTGKYWILFSQASDRAVRAVSEVGEETPYDLVAAAGYLGSLEPAIPADDITKQVIKHMNGEDE